ncbi:MAG: beta-galactosidase [Patescibacteria group bacterium]|nr:beta-galactosidase [Patescibacteria group bacterium]
MKKIIKYIAVILLIVVVAAFSFFFVGSNEPREDIRWGANFSYKHAENLGLDWRETYIALLDDLKVRRIKLITQWNLLEPNDGQFDFSDIDWQINEAEQRGVKVLLVAGMKTPRYPECHIPDWAAGLNKESRENRVLGLLETVVLRYKASSAIWAWQVENEPLFPFGKCPPKDKNFLKEEVNLVKKLDPTRPVVITDSGEWSLWFDVAKIGDVVGTTLYRKVWFDSLNIYTPYPLPSVFYGRKAILIKKLFNKEVINVELQAEPWGPMLLYDLPLEEQEKTMNPERFRNVIEFAKKTGLREFYFWGVEWWYWSKLQGNDVIWEEARSLF